MREFLKIRSVLHENKFTFFLLCNVKMTNVRSLINQRVKDLKAKLKDFYSRRNTKTQY